MKRSNYYQVHKNKKPKLVFNKKDKFIKYILSMIKKDEKSNDSISLENPFEQLRGIFILERTSKFSAAYGIVSVEESDKIILSIDSGGGTI